LIKIIIYIDNHLNASSKVCGQKKRIWEGVVHLTIAINESEHNWANLCNGVAWKLDVLITLCDLIKKVEGTNILNANIFGFWPRGLSHSKEKSGKSIESN
jgi:hypothetical protein